MLLLSDSEVPDAPTTKELFPCAPEVAVTVVVEVTVLCVAEELSTYPPLAPMPVARIKTPPIRKSGESCLIKTLGRGEALLDSNRLDHNSLQREIIAINRNAADGIEHIQPLGDFAKNCILTIEFWHRC